MSDEAREIHPLTFFKDAIDAKGKHGESHVDFRPKPIGPVEEGDEGEVRGATAAPRPALP